MVEEGVRGMISPLYKWIIVGALLVALASLGVVDTANPGAWQDWLTTFSATLVSAGLAIAGGIWLFHYQEDQRDQKRKTELAGALSTELLRMPQSVNPDPENPLEITFPDGYKASVSMGHPQAFAIEEAAKSSLFSRIFTKNLLACARNVHIYNAQASQLNWLLSTLREGSIEDPTVRKLILERVRDIKRSQADLTDRSEFLLDQLAEEEPAIWRIVQEGNRLDRPSV
jgi:hypothetical protein